jgi:hypothetical protein
MEFCHVQGRVHAGFLPAHDRQYCWRRCPVPQKAFPGTPDREHRHRRLVRSCLLRIPERPVSQFLRRYMFNPHDPVVWLKFLPQQPGP